MGQIFLLFTCFLISLNSLAMMLDGEMRPIQHFSLMHAKVAKSIETQRLDVMPGLIKGFENYVTEDHNLLSAVDIIQYVINSEEFKMRVISFLSTSGNRKYTNNKGMSNEEIYTVIMQGKELIDGDSTLGEMNFDVSRYYKGWSKVIGYTNIGKNNIIHVNGKFYKRFTPSEITGNITHEWLHLMGFVHSSAKDHDSVPYAIGYIMDELAAKYVTQGFLE